jgi:hypothetical protein
MYAHARKVRNMEFAQITSFGRCIRKARKFPLPDEPKPRISLDDGLCLPINYRGVPYRRMTKRTKKRPEIETIDHEKLSNDSDPEIPADSTPENIIDDNKDTVCPRVNDIYADEKLFDGLYDMNLDEAMKKKFHMFPVHVQVFEPDTEIVFDVDFHDLFGQNWFM